MTTNGWEKAGVILDDTGTAWPLHPLSLARQLGCPTGDFDVIHAHLDFAGILLARSSPTPVVATFHGRLDRPWAARFLVEPRRKGF